jgi:hypothetical protein
VSYVQATKQLTLASRVSDDEESLMNEADWWIEDSPDDPKEFLAGPRRLVWASVLLGLPLTFGVFFFLLHGH